MTTAGDSRADRSLRPGLALGVATMSVSISALPIFLLGALAVLVRDDLQFSESALGLAASSYYLTSALASVPGGRFSERVGGGRAIAVAASITIASLLGVATITTSWGTLIPFMLLAGSANGITLPASNLLLARTVAPQRQGAAFGLKQSSGPVATMISGASVPLIGLTIGWRWAFVIVAAIAVPLLLLGRSSPPPPGERAAKDTANVATGPLVILGLGAAVAVFGTSSLGAFYVESAVAQGISAGPAGSLLALGAGTGIAARIGWGALAGRHFRLHVPLLTVLFVSGAVGYWLLGEVMSELGLALTTILVFASGWGWPALFLYAIVVRSEPVPAIATGIAGTGLYAGGIIGPVIYGALVEASGYRAAWSFVAISSVVAGVLVFVGGRGLERAHRTALPVSVKQREEGAR